GPFENRGLSKAEDQAMVPHASSLLQVGPAPLARQSIPPFPGLSRSRPGSLSLASDPSCLRAPSARLSRNAVPDGPADSAGDRDRSSESELSQNRETEPSSIIIVNWTEFGLMF